MNLQKLRNAILHSNLFWLACIVLPAYGALSYHDYQQRLLESNPEVYGSEYASIKSKRLSKILPDQHEILTANLYFEAQGEGVNGMIAVANVVRNRVKDPEFPSTYYEVITQPKQFSWYSPNKSLTIDDEKAWELAQKIAMQELQGKLPDLVNGARFYANPRKVNIKRHQWVVKYQPLAEVGNHLYLDKPERVKQLNLKPLSKSQLSKPVQQILSPKQPTKPKPTKT